MERWGDARRILSALPGNLLGNKAADGVENFNFRNSVLASKGEGGNYTQTYMRGAAAHTHLPPREKYNLANALVLKNDEAGITGVTLHCSNT